MARMDTEASAFIADRVDEHHEALRCHGDARDEHDPIAPSLRIERSLYDARFATGYFEWRTYSAEAPTFAVSARRWVRALDRARATVLTRARAELGSAMCAAIIERVRLAHQERRTDRSAPDNPLLERLRAMIDQGGESDTAIAPGGELLAYEALRLALGDPELRSPWAPLLALWERGCAPLATLEGELLVYVPVFVRDTLVPDPEPWRPIAPLDAWPDERARTDRDVRGQWRSSHAFFFAGRRFMPREWESGGGLSLWATIHRFARHGFAPLPAMMPHTVNSSPQYVATNTPALALSTFVPRLPSARVSEAQFDAMVDEPDTDEALLERATPEGLVRRSGGFWGE
jgi:hypothetical protein